MRKMGTYFTFTCFALFMLCLPMLAQAQEPVGWWTFEKGVELEDIAGNFPDLELKDAKIDNGALDVDKGTWAVTVGDYKGPDITDKTMVSWASLDDLDVQSGSILSIDKISADEFDAIVFGERQSHRWMAGSSVFKRTKNPVPGFEETKTDVLVQLAYTYEDVGGQAHIMMYRNGEVFGDYTQGPIATHTADDAEVFFGLRHGNSETGGLGEVNAHIEEARIYDEVLGEAQIKSLRMGGTAVDARGKLATLWGAMKTK